MSRPPLFVSAPATLLLIATLTGCQSNHAARVGDTDRGGPLAVLVGNWHSTVEYHELATAKTETASGADRYRSAADGAVIINEWNPGQGHATAGLWAWDAQNNCYHGYYADAGSITTGRITPTDTDGLWEFTCEATMHQTDDKRFCDGWMRLVNRNTLTYEGKIFSDTWRLNKVAEYRGHSERK